MRGPIRPGRPLALAAAAALVVGSLAYAAAPAAADTLPDCKNVTASIADRPDSGTAGTWAADTFTRTAKICHVVEAPAPPDRAVVPVPSWTYTVVVTDDGAFTTNASNQSPGHGSPMRAGVVGKFSGGIDGKFSAPAEWQGFTPPTNTSTLDTEHWVKALFKTVGESTVQDLVYSWGWKYEVCNEAWFNGDKPHGGNRGDITGYSKRPCYGNPSFTPKCDGTVTVLLTNAAPSADAVAVYYINGKKVTVAGGKPGQVAVTATPVDGKVTVKSGIKTTVYQYAAPKCSSGSPSPVPTTSGETGLPVTGANVTGAAIGGGVLLAAGVGLVLVLRRRRVRFEA